MNELKRREFLLGAAAAMSVPFALAYETKAETPRFRFILPGNETTFTVGETVPLRLLTKTAFPRLLVTFKANGQLIGSASSFPYRIDWTPSQTGEYTLTAEVAAPRSNRTISASVKVLNLLYDAIGRRGNPLYNVEAYYSSYQSTAVPEANSYGFPMNYLATLKTPRVVRQIEVLLSATTRLYND